MLTCMHTYENGRAPGDKITPHLEHSLLGDSEDKRRSIGRMSECGTDDAVVGFMGDCLVLGSEAG